jgi:hypothetical protein
MRDWTGTTVEAEAVGLKQVELKEEDKKVCSSLEDTLQKNYDLSTVLGMRSFTAELYSSSEKLSESIRLPYAEIHKQSQSTSPRIDKFQEAVVQVQKACQEDKDAKNREELSNEESSRTERGEKKLEGNKNMARVKKKKKDSELKQMFKTGAKSLMKGLKKGLK